MNVEIVKSKELSFGLVELRSDNILTFRPNLSVFKDFNLSVLDELLKVFLEVTDGVPRPYFCDNRFVLGIVNREEMIYMNQHFEKFATACGIVTSTPISELSIDTFNSDFDSKVKVKSFLTEEEAINWLRNR